MIGVFDSGLGGLSVLAAIARELPSAGLMYFADTGHVPYGEKSDAYISARVSYIGDFLVAQGCCLLVVACNTATAAAVAALRDRWPTIPIVGVEPGIKPAAAASSSGRIAVLATESTARSDRLARLIRTHAAHVQVDVLPCPGWATRVEMLQGEDPAFVAAVRARLAPTLDAGADQVVLGCTHYAFLKPALDQVLDGRAVLVDVADAVARQCGRLAAETAVAGQGGLRLFASAQPERLQRALSALGLSWLAARQDGAVRLVDD